MVARNMRAKRTDKNQASIVADLRKAGIQVIVTNMGDNYPDLMCARYQWVLVEIKQPDGSLDRGQLEFLRDARGHVAVATTFTEAYRAVMNPQSYAITPKKQERIAFWLSQNPAQETLAVKKFFKIIEGK